MAASITNYSDQWWIPSESGWGASVLQQGDVLFIDLFVYGSDSKPTWFVAPVYYQGNSGAGHDVFAGDLIATGGTYYGAPFNPGAVSGSKVGTLTFDADTGNTATLSYTVNGVAVVKSVIRQTFRNENLGCASLRCFRSSRMLRQVSPQACSATRSKRSASTVSAT